MNGFTVLDTVTLEERHLFFYSETPVSLPIKDYNRIWPYTSNIWTTVGKGYKSVKTKIQTQKYNCRCNNNKKSSKNANKENEMRDASKKRRITKVISYK